MERERTWYSWGKLSSSLFSFCQMVRVSGYLKVKPHTPPPTPPSDQVGGLELLLRKPEALGLMAECQLIESSPSILELTVPHTCFTTTKCWNTKKVLNVDVR